VLDNKFTAKGFVVWFIAAVFFLYEFSLRIVMGTLQNDITQDLELSSLQFSLLSSTVFQVVYGLMQIPAGLIVNNIGLRYSLLASSLVCSLSAFIFAISNNYLFAIITRITMGLGASTAFICLLFSVYDWMPRKYMAIFIGLSQFIGTLGPILTTGPLDSLIELYQLNWRHVFVVLGFVGLILLFLVLFLVHNKQYVAGKYIRLKLSSSNRLAIKSLFRRVQPWYIAAVVGLVYFSVEYLSENEGRNFINLKGYSGIEASYMLGLSWIGYAFGCPILGFISDMLRRRKLILVLSSIVNLLSLSVILHCTDKLMLQAALVLLGVGASGQSIGYALMAEQFKPDFVAVGFGLNNTAITLFSALNAPLIGSLLDILVTTVPTLEIYTQVFYILILVACLALIISWLFLKETHCKSSVDFTYLKVFQ